MKPYDRAAALRYAEQWALRRNPDFFDFEELGGDCTNFASQCLYAGSRVMNFSEGQLLVSAHSFDALNRPLESYAFDRIRGIHILGVNL